MMPRLRFAALSSLLVLGVSAHVLSQAAAAGVAGVWKGTMDTQMGPLETTITIDGAMPPVGTVRIADYTGKIENGSLDGDKVAFATTIEPGTITFEGTVSGDEMTLNVTGTTGNEMTLVAKRQKSARVEGRLRASDASGLNAGARLGRRRPCRGRRLRPPR